MNLFQSAGLEINSFKTYPKEKYLIPSSYTPDTFIELTDIYALMVLDTKL